MKKLLSALLIIGCLSFCACSPKESDRRDDKSENETTAEQNDGDVTSNDEEDTVTEASDENSFRGYPSYGPMYLYRMDGNEILLDVRESYTVIDSGNNFVVEVEYNGETYKSQPVFGTEPIEVITMDEMMVATGGYNQLMQELGLSDSSFYVPQISVTPENLDNRDSYGQPITTINLEIGEEYHIIGQFSNDLCPGDDSLKQDMYIVEVGDSFGYAWCADFE